MHHGVTFTFGSNKVCSSATLRHIYLMIKMYRLQQLINIISYFYIIVIFQLTLLSN